MKKKVICILLTSLLVQSPVQARLDQHKIVLQVTEPDGSMITRNGELLIRPEAKATLILTHGFKHDKSHTKALRILFPHYNTLVFDFRGHGDKIEGQCCSFGSREVADLKAAADFVKHHPTIGHLPIFAYGASMGASTIIEAQSQYALFDGIIVDSPFESMGNVIKRGLAKISCVVFGHDVLGPIRRLLERHMYHPYVDKVLRFILRITAGMDSAHVVTCLCPVEPEQSIKKITVPTLIIGCNQDTLTPPEAVQKVYDAVEHKHVHLWLADGRGHVDAFFSHPEIYTDKVHTFISDVLKKSKHKHRL